MAAEGAILVVLTPEKDFFEKLPPFWGQNFFKKTIDKIRVWCYTDNSKTQTVEAEIKVIMIPQRVRAAESRMNPR